MAEYETSTKHFRKKVGKSQTFTSYDPIEIARQYAPKFDKPVVDMVEVVQCRDCKWYRENEAYCVYWASIYVNADATPRYTPFDYCFRGVRKDEAEK